MVWLVVLPKRWIQRRRPMTLWVRRLRHSMVVFGPVWELENHPSGFFQAGSFDLIWFLPLFPNHLYNLPKHTTKFRFSKKNDDTFPCPNYTRIPSPFCTPKHHQHKDGARVTNLRLVNRSRVALENRIRSTRGKSWSSSCKKMIHSTNGESSHEKNLPTFHYTGWLIGILIITY